MRRKFIFGVVMVMYLAIGGGPFLPPVWAFRISSPVNGADVEAGSTVKVRVDPEEVKFLTTILFNAHGNKYMGGFGTGMGGGYDLLPPYEWELEIPKDYLGPLTVGAMGRVLGQKTGEPPSAEVTVNVVVPPTTVLTEISAAIDGKGQGFMTLYKHDNGNLVQTSRSFNKVTAEGEYSDGIRREITDHLDTTYTSSDEKVLKVTPPGKWMLNDEFPQLPRSEKDERHGSDALVTAVGPGRAKIIVRNGTFEASVIGIVSVKPCSEWKKRAFKDNLPICD